MRHKRSEVSQQRRARAVFEAGANDEFTVNVAEKPEEIKALLELGFE